MARLEMPLDAAMTPEQSIVCAEAVAGRRGKVPAPMIAWLRNPELARRGQAVGELLRFETSLEQHLSELAILICGRHWTSHHEWKAHKALALKAGLDAEIIAAIAARNTPSLPDERHYVVYEVSSTLLATRTPSPSHLRPRHRVSGRARHGGADRTSWLLLHGLAHAERL
jgi:4-carboxymuconolactone decarboxylase